MVEDASRDDMTRAVTRLKSRIRPDSTVMLFFGGYGARAKLVVVDASRRNPYERRFRAFSHGLAPISAPDNALILSSAMPGQVVHDSRGQYSVLMTELLDNLGGKTGIEAAFNNTRAAIARSSEGEQVPAVSSSLLEDVNFGATENAGG